MLMAGRPEQTPSHWDRSQSHTENDTRKNSNPSGPSRRVGSTDITGCGGQFEGSEGDYPPQLYISEEDDPPADEEIPFGSAPFRQSPSLTDGPAQGTASPTPHTHERLLTSTPYLPKSELETFYRLRDGKRIRSRRTKSSGTNSTEYLSAENPPPSSKTDDSRERVAEELQDPEREPTPYFTPRNSPSLRSAHTTEDEVPVLEGLTGGHEREEDSQ